MRSSSSRSCCWSPRPPRSAARTWRCTRSRSWRWRRCCSAGASSARSGSSPATCSPGHGAGACRPAAGRSVARTASSRSSHAPRGPSAARPPRSVLSHVSNVSADERRHQVHSDPLPARLTDPWGPHPRGPESRGHGGYRHAAPSCRGDAACRHAAVTLTHEGAVERGTLDTASDAKPHGRHHQPWPPGACRDRRLGVARDRRADPRGRLGRREADAGRAPVRRRRAARRPCCARSPPRSKPAAPARRWPPRSRSCSRSSSSAC